MLAPARHQRILALLRDRGHVTAAALRRELGVTAMTVWRDLRMLEELGLLRRERGGARPAGQAAGEPDFEMKSDAAAAAKQRIAARAVREFVRAGDTIALEGGTTVAAIIDHLPESQVSIVTNSLPVAQRLRLRRPALAVRVIGGWLSPVSGNMTGPDALREIGRLAASVCFISATAFDREIGPSDPNPLEIEAKRALAAISRRVVLLLDSGKFARRSAAVTLHPRRIDTLITDKRPPAGIPAMLRRHGVRILVCPESTAKDAKSQE
ncbi:DeoR/GlpR family DNA-binding transcription regulator [Termitidicoccus mucosus]|uniref:DeoR family transcriptional regulator n=1 Tax=Termitidicoccus mucosus TaxID=1184151 RepID=A0A178IIP8_9BACT|nr:DeoR family transcriptional regulator [Opitutaceae bacterium TSB47]